MPALADELGDIRTFNGRRGPRCGVAIFLNNVDPAIGETVQAALDDPTIESKALSRWLDERHGIELSHWTIQYHRRGDCRCG